MLPDPNVASTVRQGQGGPGTRDPSQEKRILVTGKRGEKLLDVTLGESCFERVARTGIAVSVWEDMVGTNGELGVGAVGGVSGTRARVFMIQVCICLAVSCLESTLLTGFLDEIGAGVCILVFTARQTEILAVSGFHRFALLVGTFSS
jgi:hypothetical protein